MGNKQSAEICKDDYIIIEELEVGVNNTVRESTSIVVNLTLKMTYLIIEKNWNVNLCLIH